MPARKSARGVVRFRAAALCALIAILASLPGAVRADASGATTPAHASADTGGRVIVFFRPGVTPGAQHATLALAGFSAARGNVVAELPQVRQATVVASPIQRWILERSKPVQGVYDDTVVTLEAIPDDPLFAEQPSLQDSHLPQAWDTYPGVGGFAPSGPFAGAPIAVVDSGIDPAHIEFQPFTSKVPVCVSYAPNLLFDPVDCHSRDDIAHGTHVAGIAAADTDNGAGIAGISPTSPIYVYKACQGRFCWVGDVVSGIVDATDAGAKVVNFSLGGPAALPPYREAVDYALAHDVVVVAAAGNAANGAYSYPASFNGVLSVGALVTGTGNRAWFSQVNDRVDIAAPGTSILSSVAPGAAGGEESSYAYYSGTSMATPHVAGVAALLRSAHPDWSAGRTRAALLNTATDVATPGRDRETGRGRVDAAAAMTYTPVDDGDLDKDGIADQWDAAPDDPAVYNLFDLAGSAKTESGWTVSSRWATFLGWFSFGVVRLDSPTQHFVAFVNGHLRASSLHSANVTARGLLLGTGGIRSADLHLRVDDTGASNAIAFDLVASGTGTVQEADLAPVTSGHLAILAG